MVHSVSTQVTIMAAGSSRVSEVVFESISEEPHQPKAINFPRDHLEKKIQFFVVFNRNGSPNFHFSIPLRQLKTYLHATMKQDRVNYLMLLRVHKDKTDELDLKLLVNEFINSDHRSNIFSKME